MPLTPKYKLASYVANYNRNNTRAIPKPIPKPIIINNINFRHNTILIVLDQLINFKNIPENILQIMPGYQAFKSLGIQFDNIYNNRQDCSPSRASFCSSQLNINIGDNIDQVWQYEYNDELNTSFDTIGKSLKRNGVETVWYGKNHFVSAIATDVNTVPAFNTNTRDCLKEYGYDIYNTFGDSYYYSNQGMFADNIAFDLKVNYKNQNVDFVDSTGKYIGAIPYLKSRAKNDKAFHLELHLENPHDTQHFWQNFAQKPAKSQLQFWAPYISEQILLLKASNPDIDISDPYNFSASFPDAYIENPNLVTNYFEDTFLRYVENSNSIPFEESYLKDYILDPSSNNSQFPYYLGMMEALKGNTTIPSSKEDIMSWKNLINNYYGLLLEIDHYVYQVYLLLKTTDMLKTTSVTIISDHGDMMSSHGLKQKGYPFENSCNIACLTYSPYIPVRLRGTKSNVLGSLLDIAPTMETLANIKVKSVNFLGKSLLEWDDNNLVPRKEDQPVFNIYTSWMSYLSYFNYKSWEYQNPTNTVLANFNPSSFYDYQSFFTMTVDIIDGQKYKLARYFNFIELLEYNWVFNPKLLDLNLDANIIKQNFSSDLMEIPMLQNDISNASILVESYFTDMSWNFGKYYQYIKDNTSENDDLIKTLMLIPIINITTANIGFSYKMPGYYNPSYEIYNNFLEYYDDPDHHYYYFMYNLNDDPNEVTNLLDKAYPDRQTSNVLATATLLNDKLNLLIDKYEIVYFDFIVPTKIFISLALNLFIYKGVIDNKTANAYASCFEMGGSDGEQKTTKYYNDTLEIFKNLSCAQSNENNNEGNVTYYNTKLIDSYSDPSGIYVWQGLTKTIDNQILICGTTNPTANTGQGVIYIGNIICNIPGEIYNLSVPDAQYTSCYGPRNNYDSVFSFVGSYTNYNNTSGAINAFLFRGTLSDLGISANYTYNMGINTDKNIINFAHSTDGNLVVGNSGGILDTTALSWVYNITDGSYTEIQYPGSKTTTTYGIIQNEYYDNIYDSYTIIGGYSIDTSSNIMEIYNMIDPSNTLQGIPTPGQYAYIADIKYQRYTNEITFQNWTTIEYKSDYLTHFEGISKINDNTYTISADVLGINNEKTGFFVTINRNLSISTSTFTATKWVPIDYGSSLSPPVIGLNTCNSVVDNKVVGLFIEPTGTTTAFQAVIL